MNDRLERIRQEIIAGT
jgi:hypothetical protein